MLPEKFNVATADAMDRGRLVIAGIAAKAGMQVVVALGNRDNGKKVYDAWLASTDPRAEDLQSFTIPFDDPKLPPAPGPFRLKLPLGDHHDVEVTWAQGGYPTANSGKIDGAPIEKRRPIR